MLDCVCWLVSQRQTHIWGVENMKSVWDRILGNLGMENQAREVIKPTERVLSSRRCRLLRHSLPRGTVGDRIRHTSELSQPKDCVWLNVSWTTMSERLCPVWASHPQNQRTREVSSGESWEEDPQKTSVPPRWPPSFSLTMHSEQKRQLHNVGPIVFKTWFWKLLLAHHFKGRNSWSAGPIILGRSQSRINITAGGECCRGGKFLTLLRSTRRKRGGWRQDRLSQAFPWSPDSSNWSQLL